MERLVEFIACDYITGEALCDSILDSLTNVGLDPYNCRSQTMDCAGNMAGVNRGCATRPKQHSPRAVHHYCSSHDLNLVLCTSCSLKVTFNLNWYICVSYIIRFNLLFMHMCIYMHLWRHTNENVYKKDASKFGLYRTKYSGPLWLQKLNLWPMKD